MTTKERTALEQVEDVLQRAEQENYSYDIIIIGRDVWQEMFENMMKFDDDRELPSWRYPTYCGTRVVIDEHVRDEIRVAKSI